MASPPPVFAIIVGIDKYDASDNLGTLRGAVSDAESFRTYLTDSRSLGGLAVPHSHILFLANENATRSAILGAFDSHFLDNLDIPEHEDAAMIFYFAGHGSRVASPGNVLPVDGRVEVICPVDERTVGADGQYVHGIPDYLLGRVFREISRKKGPNITVILDSCHSGGMGRVEDVQRVARTASLPIPLDLDGHRWSDDSESTTTDYNVWTPADSHVLLAACTQNGIAYETPSEPFHGQFTNALISALRSTSLASTTYAELLARLPPMVEQTPHCGGANKDCALFTTSYSVGGRRTWALTEQLMPDAYGDDDGELLQSFVIPIGSVEGVRPGTEFAVYDPDGAVVATLVARTVRINEAVLTSEEYEPVVLPLGARAGVINWRNEDMVLQIYISPEFPYTTELFPLVHTDVPHRYMQVDSLEKAQLSLTHIGDGVVLLRWLAGAMARGPHSERRFTAAGVDWPSILDALSHFHYFLELTSGSTLTAFSLEMHRLLGEYPGRMPDRSGDNGGNLIQDGCVHLRSREDAKYGFTMRNSWYEELFPYLFYFNPIEYTIRRWFVPESAHRAPLTAAGTVVVGMGSEGAFSFTLPPGDTVESSSGFVKMFVSTVYLDLGWIEQRVSPFDDKFHDSGRLFSSREQLETGEGWNSLCVFLTMSNGESGS